MAEPEKKDNEDQIAGALKDVSDKLSNLTVMFKKLIDEVGSIARTMSTTECRIQNNERNERNAEKRREIEERNKKEE